MESGQAHEEKMHGRSEKRSPYTTLAFALAINGVVMYVITYAMIASIDHFHANINRAYMAGMMVAPMITVMLLMMRSMFTNRALNVLLHVGAVALFIGFFLLARTQTAVGNEQFLHSMIPHHSSAILMCDEANITDPEIRTLCEQIVKAQKEEIAQMEEILSRY